MNIDIEHVTIVDTNKWEEIKKKGLILLDKKIADSIIKLNKLGYETEYSCSGHFVGEYTYEQNNCDISFIDEVENDKHSRIFNKGDKTFDYVSENSSTSIYIMFRKNYQFKNLPEGFLEEEGNIIRHVIYYLHEGRRRSGKDIVEEIDKYNEILRNWVDTLPNNK